MEAPRRHRVNSSNREASTKGNAEDHWGYLRNEAEVKVRIRKGEVDSAAAGKTLRHR